MGNYGIYGMLWPWIKFLGSHICHHFHYNYISPPSPSLLLLLLDTQFSHHVSVDLF